MTTTATIETRTDEIRGTTYHCTECGRWEKADKGGVIRHSKHCDSQAQAHVVAAPTTPLETFARDVRRTATTKGRDADVLTAVRTKRLSVDDAMNTDD